MTIVTLLHGQVFLARGHRALNNLSYDDPSCIVINQFEAEMQALYMKADELQRNNPEKLDRDTTRFLTKMLKIRGRYIGKVPFIKKAGIDTL